MIEGARDQPVISVEAGDSTGGTYTQDTLPSVLSGTLTVTDVDLTDTLYLGIGSARVTNVGAGSPFSSADLLLYMSSVTPNPVLGPTEITGIFTWSLDLSPYEFDYVPEGASLELELLLTASDTKGGNDSEAVCVTITGENDAPIVFSLAPSTFFEQEDASSQDLTQTRTVWVDDADAGDLIDISFLFNGDMSRSGGTLDPTLARDLIDAFTVGATPTSSPISRRRTGSG